MSRFLHRPMFRRGGSAGEGITSGLRPGYNRGRVVNPGGYAGEEYSIFASENMEEYDPESYEVYIKEDGTIGRRKKKKIKTEGDYLFPGIDLAAEAKKKSIMDFVPEKVDRKEPVIEDTAFVEDEVLPEGGFDFEGGVPTPLEDEDVWATKKDLIPSSGSGLPGGEEEKPSGGIDLFGEAPKLPKSTAGADFWLNLGTNILAQPGGRPILQTLGTAGKEPLARYQQQRGQEGMLKYKHAQAERAFNLEIYKAMTDEDKIALQERIDYLMSEHGLSKQEALNRALPEFRKSMNPDDVARQAKEAEREKIYERAEKTRTFMRTEEGESVSPEQAIVINEFTALADTNDWRYASTPFIDWVAIGEEWRDAGKKQTDWIDDGGNIAVPPDQQDNYDEGLYYVDHFNGDVYKVGPESTELIKIDLSEIKIN